MVSGDHGVDCSAVRSVRTTGQVAWHPSLLPSDATADCGVLSLSNHGFEYLDLVWVYFPSNY